MYVYVQGPSPPCHETSHNLREKDFRDYRQDRRHPRDRDADRSHVGLHTLYSLMCTENWLQEHLLKLSLN